MNKVRIQAFHVRGSSIRTNNAMETTASGKIPGLWAQLHAEHPDPAGPLYGIYSDYESDASGEYMVTAGMETRVDTDATITIRAGTYLVFPATGTMPDAIIDAWKSVWAHFSEPHAYVRAYETDFEKYGDPGPTAIYIGIRECDQ